MNIKLKLQDLLCAVAIGLIATSSSAIEYKSKQPLKFENEFRYFMEGALHKGGDNTESIPLYDRATDSFYSGEEVVVVGNYNGVSSEEQFRHNIEAGGFYRVSLGAEFPVAQDVAFSAAVGYLFDEITGDLTDGSEGKGFASYKTTVVDFLGFYYLGRHRFGLGGSFHYNPKFDYKEVGEDFQMHGVYRFSNALGASIQYDFLVSENTSMGLRYTDISYDFEEVVIGDVDSVSATQFTTECIAQCEELLDASSISGHITYRF